MNETLFALAVHLRLMNIAYHSAHNLASGIGFFGDHQAFEEFYKTLDDDYDAVVERSIGMGFLNVANLKMQFHIIDAHIGILPDIIDFHTALTLEIHLNEIINHLDSDQGITAGLKQLIGDIGHRSEIRQYKIKQRIKGA